MRGIELWSRRRIIRDMDTDEVVPIAATGARTQDADTPMSRHWRLHREIEPRGDDEAGVYGRITRRFDTFGRSWK